MQLGARIGIAPYPVVGIEVGGLWLWFRHERDASLTERNPSWPYLVEVGDIRIEARSAAQGSIGGGETPSVAVALNNANHRAYRLIGLPHRCRALVADDAGNLIDGVVTDIEYGVTMRLEIEI